MRGFLSVPPRPGKARYKLDNAAALPLAKRRAINAAPSIRRLNRDFANPATDTPVLRPMNQNASTVLYVTEMRLQPA
jgi:hypothetical protein